MKKECWNCVGYLFFKPLSDDTMTCCESHGETVKDINLETGVSPAIQRHKIEKVPCRKFKKGKSQCWPSKKSPFRISPLRANGERVLLQRLNEAMKSPAG